MRLGIGLGLLMKELHARHLAAFLGILDTVEKQDRPIIDAVDREVFHNDSKPECGELIDLHRVTVEEMQ